MSALAFALAASLAWGSADFLGGLASRRVALLTVLLVSQFVGLALLMPVMVALDEPPPAGSYLLLAALSGAFNAIALGAFYRGLALGTMSVVAPIAATDAVIPVVFGIVSGERPAPVEIAGVAIALVGVVLVSRPADEERDAGGRRLAAQGIGLGLLAAVCFGCFVVTLDGASEGGVLWAVAASRWSTVILVAFAVVARVPGGLRFERRDVATLVSIGVLDVAAVALFAFATTAGLLSHVGVLGALYPVVTVLLARIVLRERLDAVQRMGAAGALGGAALIAVG